MSSTSWALGLIWSTNAFLALGLVTSSLVRGIVPAGVAIVGRALINAFVDHSGRGGEALEALLPWLGFGFGLAFFEAISPLTEKFFTQRLHDDVNLKITGDILDHAARLDVAFFEDPRRREMIERAQQNPADHFINFVRETQAALTNFLQTISLVAILVLIEPWVLLVLAPSALPYLFFQWRLSRRYYLEEYHRTPKRRWTHYFVSLLTDRHSLTEIKLVGLAPFLIRQFRLLITQFRDQDRSLHRRSLAGSSIFAAVTTVAFYVIFVRVVLKALAGVLTVGDIAIFGGATSRVRFTLEKVIQSISSAMEQTLYISNLIDFLNVKPRIRSGSNLVRSTGRGEIEFNDVFFSYPGSTKPTLNGVSLHIEPGRNRRVGGRKRCGQNNVGEVDRSFIRSRQWVCRVRRRGLETSVFGLLASADVICAARLCPL